MDSLRSAALHQRMHHIEVDTLGIIYSVDPMIRLAFGFDEAELVGKSGFDLIDRRDRDDVLAILTQAVRESRLFRVRISHRPALGQA